MSEVDDLPAAALMSDTDLFLVFQPGVGVNKSRKVERQAAMLPYIKTGAAADLGVVDADAINAPVGAINTLTVATGIVLGATVSKILTATATIAIPTLAAGASSDVTMTVTGAVVGDVAIVNPQADLPDGLMFRPYVSGSNTVTMNATNGSAASIPGASYSFKAVLLRVS